MTESVGQAFSYRIAVLELEGVNNFTDDDWTIVPTLGKQSPTKQDTSKVYVEPVAGNPPSKF